MFYTVYKVTNLVNGKVYIGKHQTKKLDDGYMGSGKRIKAAILKHGIENFQKDILFQFEDEASMNAKEAELVTEDFCRRSDVYNLCSGGRGGFGYINGVGLAKFRGKAHTDETKTKIRAKRLQRDNPFPKEPWNKGLTGAYSEERMAKFRQPRSEETKRKLSEAYKRKRAGVAQG